MVGSTATITLVAVNAKAATTTRGVTVAVVAAMGIRVATMGTRVAVAEAATRGAEATRTIIIGAAVEVVITTSLAQPGTPSPMPSVNSSIRSAKRCD